MPAPNPFPSTQPVLPQPVPALHLFPLNDTFIPKHIHLNQRIKIGRQTNAKTVPGERNGYFDSKVLSRQHAEVWEENGKIFIKDVKSSNGTFINGERLSPEGVESEPFELKSDDIVEFGIDIVGEDNKTIIHHKVAARVTCVLSPEDALASRDPTHFTNAAVAFHSPNSLQQGQQNHAQQRRPGALAPPNPTAGLGSMGAPAGRPGTTKSGLTFEHILSRLQNGLIQSRETGQELGRLGDQMGDIGDTLGGSNPGPIHTYPQSLPPVRPHVPEPHAPSLPAHATVPSQVSHPTLPVPDTLATLQSQLADTQSTLAIHVEKIHALERLSHLNDLSKEHEAIKREVSLLRGMVNASKLSDQVDDCLHDEHEEGDEDDSRSVVTITPDDGEGPQLDEHGRAEVQDDDDERRQGLLGRPRTPEPIIGMHSFRDDDEEDPRGIHDPDLLADSTHPRTAPTQSLSIPPPPQQRRDGFEELAARLATVVDQLDNVLAMSRSLQAQQSAAQSTIEHLEAKVTALEGLVHSANARADQHSQPSPQPPQPPSPQAQPQHSPTLELLTWQHGVEKQWNGVREEWAQERLRLDRAREEWEGRMRAVEEGMRGVTSNNDVVAAHEPFAGLVTPPSPRSLSADSTKSRRRRSRSKGKNKGAWRSKSPPPLAVPNGDAHELNSMASKRARSFPSYDGTIKEGEIQNGEARRSELAHGSGAHLAFATVQRRDKTPESGQEGHRQVPLASVSTVVGVLLLSVAAAAVYRVRE